LVLYLLIVKFISRDLDFQLLTHPLLSHSIIEYVFDLIFFIKHGFHPDLLSFPTRRSSDLAAVGAMAICGIFLVQIIYTVWLEKTDRKSTRLNSSHVSISYAVFCLKKKTRDVPFEVLADACDGNTHPLLEFVLNDEPQKHSA